MTQETKTPVQCLIELEKSFHKNAHIWNALQDETDSKEMHKMMTTFTHSFMQSYELFMEFRNLYIEKQDKEKAATDKFLKAIMAQDRSPRKGSGKHKLLEALRVRSYPVSILTLKRLTGLTKGSIYSYIMELRNDGYNIKTKHQGTRISKYRLEA